MVRQTRCAVRETKAQEVDAQQGLLPFPSALLGQGKKTPTGAREEEEREGATAFLRTNLRTKALQTLAVLAIGWGRPWIQAEPQNLVLWITVIGQS